MIDVSAIKAFDYKLAREAEVVANLKCFLIDVFC